jgi:methyltransferase family protein
VTARVRAGWSRTAVPIAPEMSVLDVGSGAFPNPRATICVDRDLYDNRHRAGAGLVRDRPLVCADVMALPFRDGAFDFVIASHLAEHVDDPDGFCREVSRVASAGYIETPSPIADVLLHEDYHLWRVSSRSGWITFRHKGKRSRLVAALCDRFYRVYNAAQPQCERPTYRLPDNIFGKVARIALRSCGGVLNRLGVMHTRVHFAPTRPLRWRTIR